MEKGRENLDKEIGYFHKLIGEFKEQCIEGSEYFYEAISIEEEAIEIYQKGIDKRNKAFSIAQEAYEWLLKYDEDFKNRSKENDYEEIEEELIYMIKEIIDAEQGGLEYINSSLKEWKDARCLDEEFNKLFEEYIKLYYQYE